MNKTDIKNFTPWHINADHNDFKGNDKNGRYVFICGSAARAKEIAVSYFSEVEVKTCPRGYDLYLGHIKFNNHSIQVASISTGMGTPSVDIILSELILLGAKRFLRIGTAGSLQDHVKIDDVVFANAAVRDEGTSSNYVPTGFPAVCSTDFLIEANKLKKISSYPVHLGIIHTKDSLYAREFLYGPQSDNSHNFMKILHQYGVLASEMECSHLYVLSQVYSKQFGYQIKSGCVLGIVGSGTPFANNTKIQQKTTTNILDFGIKLMTNLALNDDNS